MWFLGLSFPLIQSRAREEQKRAEDRRVKDQHTGLLHSTCMHVCAHTHTHTHTGVSMRTTAALSEDNAPIPKGLTL